MIRKFAIIPLLFLLSALSLAQTTVTGTIVDANLNPYANGTVSTYFLPSSGQGAPFTLNSTTNASGAFSIVLKSAGAYQFTVCAMPVNIGPLANPTPTQICAYSSPIQISGGVQDVSSQINAVAPLLGPKTNNGNGSPISGSTALGTQVGGNGIGGFSSTLKPVIDVRDYGVDCTDTIDSTTNFTAAITAAGNYGKVLVPAHCLFRISGAVGLALYKVYGLELEFAGRQGNACDNQGPNPAGIDYRQTYASGNTVISIKDSQRLLFKNLTIYTNGGADNGVLIDQDLATPPITTRNDFMFPCILNNTSTRNASWAGFNVSPVSISNVESIHFYHPDVTCSQSAPTSSSSNGYAIVFGPSANLKNEIVDDYRSTNCSQDVVAKSGGDITFQFGLASNSYTNIGLGAFNDALYGFRTENATQAVTVTNSIGPHLIEHNDFAASAGTIIDCPSGCGWMTLINNQQDSSATTTINPHGGGGHLFAANNRNSNFSPIGFNDSFVFSGPASSPGAYGANDWSWLTGSFRYTISQLAAAGIGSIGIPSAAVFFDTAKFNAGQQYDHFGIQANPENADNSVGLSINYLGSNPANGYIGLGATVAGLKVGAVTQTAMSQPAVGFRGTPGATTWSYVIQANTVTGHSDCSPVNTVLNGPAVLNGTNFEFIQWDPYVGAMSYSVYRTASGGTPVSTGLIGIVPALYRWADPVAAGLSLPDTGLAGDGTTCVAGNTTGAIVAGAGIVDGVGRHYGALIANGNTALNTNAIASQTCDSVVTVTANGVLATDVLRNSLNGDITGVTGYAPLTSGTLTIYAYPSTNAVNFKICNSTSGSITPGAVTLNWQVIRGE